MRIFTMGLMAIAALPAFAWRGFDWETWRAETGVEKPDVTRAQAGRIDLLPLVTPGVTTPADWEAKRAEIVAVLSAFLGEPTPMTPPAPSAEELGREDMGSYERIHLRIASEADDTIPAYLLRPKEIGDEPAPVMIVLHQTQAPGKAEAVGMTGDPNMHFAKELAERGVMCIAPDAIGFGERIPEGGEPYDGAMTFYAKHPQWSFFGKMCWDLSRIIDYLETLPEVDPKRIGVMGHSHGAYGSIMGAVFEPRIALVMASCGFTTLRTDPRPDRWSHLTALMPRLGFYTGDIFQAPFDWHEIAACIAPRPFLNYATLNDDIFPGTDNLPEVYWQLNETYRLYDRRDEFAWYLVPGPHRFPVETHGAVYDWIEGRFDAMRNPAGL